MSRRAFTQLQGLNRAACGTYRRSIVQNWSRRLLSSQTSGVGEASQEQQMPGSLPTATTSTPTTVVAATQTQPNVVPDRLLRCVVVRCQGNERAVLRSYAKFIEMACGHLGIQRLPIEFDTPTYERITLLKSVFKHKDHRAQYEFRNYSFKLTLQHLTGSTADTFIEYIQRMCPEGVAMKITEHELMKFPPALQSIMDDIKNSRRKAQEQLQPDQ